MAPSLTLVIFLSTVIVSYITPGYTYGIFAAVLGTFACDFFVTAPRLGFSFTNGSPITLLIMLIVSFIISTITAQMKKQTQLAKERERRVQFMYEINQIILLSKDLDSIINSGCKYLSDSLFRSAAFFLNEPSDSDGPLKAHYLKMYEGKDESFFTDTQEKKQIIIDLFNKSRTGSIFHENDIYYVPIALEKDIKGVYAIDCEDKYLTQSEKSHAQILSGQITLAMERYYLAESQEKILMETEREKMRSNLLRSISHDLRTPLTSIIGAGATIKEAQNLDKDSEEQLIEDIIEDAGWLMRIIENTLAITKISGDGMKVTKTMDALEEIISYSVTKVRRRYKIAI